MVGVPEAAGAQPGNTAATACPIKVVEPVEECKRVLATAEALRNSAGWTVALALRRFEALALQWKDIDLDRGTLPPSRSAARPRRGSRVHGAEH